MRILGDVLALCAGVLFTFAFSPFNNAYFSIIALLLAFYTWQTQAKRALWRGFLFGLGEFGLGVSWVIVSIHQFGKADIISSIALTSLFVCFWAIFPAITAYFCAKLVKQRVLLMPVVWVLIEFLRGRWVLNGFPWLVSSYAHLETPLAGFIPLVGAFGTSFLVVFSAALILDGVQKRQYWQAVVLSLLWLSGAYLKTVHWTYPIGAPFSVALLQGNIAQDKKWLPENRDKTLRLYKTLTEQNWDAKLIIWPETSIPAYKHEVYEHFLIPLHEAAKQHKTNLVVSLPIKEESDEKFNAVMTLGSTMADYRKQHLLPFGEFMPWQPVSGFVLQLLKIRLGHFTEGSDHQALLTGAGFAFNTSICYEDVFGHLAIQGLAQAAFLVNVTNDGWFGDSIEPHQHAQLARMRALETGRYLLRSTNSGLTAVIMPDGQMLRMAPLFEVAVLKADITPMAGLTPYARIGDMPSLYFLLITLLAYLIWEYKPLRSTS